MGPNSDIDLLVVKSGRFNRDRVTRDIYRHLSVPERLWMSFLQQPKIFDGTVIRLIWSITQPCEKGRSFMGRRRYPPTDLREWLNRAGTEANEGNEEVEICLVRYDLGPG